ncbi:unnamed protein product [Urochloa decumbens]|uniref:DUF674 family protein n=1 Tax=Urochloa decumbens TaxID=240449 RepID=A0ABC8Z1G4_9POAL
MATTGVTMSMKLIIDKKAQRLLFAEASKDVVDFLFSLLALPVATAVKLLGEEDMVGSVGNLYASVGKLESTYVLGGVVKDTRAPLPHRALVRYSNCRSYVTAVYGGACPACRGTMKTAVTQLVPSAGSGQTVVQSAANGLVQGIVTYVVTDNLTVTPMSAVSASITLLNTLSVKDVSDLQEKTVQLGYNEGLAILKASLQSKTVLTDVFLSDNKAQGGRASLKGKQCA